MLRFVSVAALALWVTALGLGFGAMARFEGRPGPSGSAPPRWPKDSAVPRDGVRPILLMFVHPRCPCTAASLHELERLLVHVAAVDPWVVVVDDGLSENRAAAESIPGVHVRLDPNGIEAALFGSHTSGEVVVYAADGALRFSGGITGSRGHEGDNLGSAAALAAAISRPSIPAAPVFGCRLEDLP